MEALLERWGRFVARWPFLIIALWIVIVFAALHFGPSLSAISAKQNTSSLPASAPSMRANQLYTTKFAAGKLGLKKEINLLVLTDPQGISTQELALAEHIEAWLQAPGTRPVQLLSVTGPGAQLPVSAFESSDHQALRLILTWDISKGSVPESSIKAIYDYLANQAVPQGGTLGLTGSAPISYDLSTSIFNTGSGSGGVNSGSLLGLLIILVVLGFVYRSPLAVIVPLISVGLAFGLSVPIIAWAGQNLGVAVASFSLQYVFFVLLGVGTNYGVFMLSRYKEEIRRSRENTPAARREALGRSVGHVGESIMSSAATVVVATAIMGLAQLYTLRVTGPAIAIGVVCLLLAGLSLLPALMALCGKSLFWPAQPRPQTLTDASATEKGLWARAGHLVTTHPRIVALVALVMLLPLTLSTMLIEPSFDDLKSLPTSAPSVRAFNAYRTHFKETAQVQVILNDPGHDLRQVHYAGDIAQVTTAIALDGNIAAVTAVLCERWQCCRPDGTARCGSVLHRGTPGGRRHDIGGISCDA
jgi:putative drug exporter of the RND superfamily